MERVQADHLARQVEAEHLLAAMLVDHIGLHRSCAHRGDRTERIADAKHVPAGVVGTDMLDQHVQIAQRGFVIPFGRAGAGERAAGAEIQCVAVVGPGMRRRRLHGAVVHRASPPFIGARSTLLGLAAHGLGRGLDGFRHRRDSDCPAACSAASSSYSSGTPVGMFSSTISLSRHVVEHLHHGAQAVAMRRDQHVRAGAQLRRDAARSSSGSTRASVSFSDSVAGSRRGSRSA